jgi:hypothetical protein
MKLSSKGKKNKRILSPKHAGLLSRLKKVHKERKDFQKPKYRPMATPIKKPGDKKITLSLLSNSLRLSRKKIVSGIVLALLTISIFITLFTDVFKVKKLIVIPKSALNCVSESVLEKKIVKDNTFIWSALFYNKKDLVNTVSCLNSLKIAWTPMDFHTYTVNLSVKVPVLKVKILTTESTDRNMRQDDLFTVPVSKESILYSTSNGSLLKFEENLNLPEIKLRVFENEKIQKIPTELLTTIYQLRTYFMKEYSEEPVFETTSGGTIRVSLSQLETSLFTYRVSLGSQLNSLQALLKQSTINKAKIELIDLRFGNPVVRFKK